MKSILQKSSALLDRGLALLMPPRAIIILLPLRYKVYRS